MRVVVCRAGIGNVRSVVRALEHAGASALSGTLEVLASADPEQIRRADALVVPGQGAFGSFARAMEGGLGDALVERIRAGAPYLGICLGLQVLFAESEESPGVRGLGLFEGRVRRLEPGVDPRTGLPLPLPHIGWNLATPVGEGGGPLLPSSEHFYFAHTYVAEPADRALVLATSEYGERFASAALRENVAGVQFHPEKSQRAGLALLERFLARAKRGSS